MGKTKKKPARKTVKGSVLPFTVMVVLISFLIGLALLRLGLSARIQSIRTTDTISARCAADAGIIQAMRLMNKKIAEETTWNNDNLPTMTNVPLPYADASYSFKIGGYPGSGFLITSQGQAGAAAQKTIYRRLGVKSLWTGIGVKEGINIKLGATFSTDPPNSDLFSIRTNSTSPDAITIKAGVTIPGDVVIGPGGDIESVVDTKSSTTIEGDVYAAEDEIDFPPVIVPAVFGALPSLPYTYTPGTPITGGTYKFSGLSIPNSGVQEIQGDCVIYVDGKTILGQSAELIVKPNSSLVLYLGGDMEAKNSNGLDNETGDARALKIYGTSTCENIDLKAKGDVFFGAIYAPDADLDAYAKNELAGSFIGKSFTLMTATNFTFVTALLDDNINNMESYLLARWWEE